MTEVYIVHNTHCSLSWNAFSTYELAKQFVRESRPNVFSRFTTKIFKKTVHQYVIPGKKVNLNMPNHLYAIVTGKPDCSKTHNLTLFKTLNSAHLSGIEGRIIMVPYRSETSLYGGAKRRRSRRRSARRRS